MRVVFANSNSQIIADVRESRYVVQSMRKIGVEVVEKTISPGDYIVCEGFVVERKTFRDFVASIFRKRLFDQVERLCKACGRCCLVVEGDVGYSGCFAPQ